jgi:cysteine synthase
MRANSLLDYQNRFHTGHENAPYVENLIGNTPLLRIECFMRQFPRVQMLAKAEWFNPGGSVKVRAAARIVAEAFRAGRLGPGEAQKITLDLAAQQSTEVTDSIRRAFRLPAGAPGMFMFDIAGQMVARYVDTQKSLLDLIVEQSSAMLETTRDRGDSGSRIAGNMANALQDSVDRAVTAQMMMLDLAAQQTREVTEAVKQQTGISGTPAAAAADSVQMGMDILVDAQTKSPNCHDEGEDYIHNHARRDDSHPLGDAFR